MTTYTTNCAEETQKIAHKIAKKIKNGAILALIGDLGSGKTTFTQGFAKGLGIKEKVISPTFILMRQYSLPGSPKAKLFHIDLYRFENIKEIESLGLNEIFSNPKNIILIEWAEKLGKLLPKQAVKIYFTHTFESGRKIEVQD